jgi:hypothetical protein
MHPSGVVSRRGSRRGLIETDRLKCSLGRIRLPQERGNDKGWETFSNALMVELRNDFHSSGRSFTGNLWSHVVPRAFVARVMGADKFKLRRTFNRCSPNGIQPRKVVSNGPATTVSPPALTNSLRRYNA